MLKRTVPRTESLSTLATLLALFSVPAAAQAQAPVAADEPSEGITDIIVTAERRETSLQDTPISIVALTSADLANKNINDLTDLRSQVPGLQITPHPNSATTARIFIRGVGNNDDQITQDPSVAVYLDGVYVARSQGLAGDVAELERIEVLRGPQGSLYGRNATGGAINFITKAPQLGKFGAEQKFTYGNLGQFRSLTRVNAPIGDTLAVELGYLRAEEDGFVDNLGTGVARFGDKRRDAYRGAVHWKPAATLDARYTYDRTEIADTPSFIARVPLYPLVAPRPAAGSPLVRDLRRNDVIVQGHNLTLAWEAGDNLTIKSITGYRKLSNGTYQDYLTGALGPFPLVITTFASKQRQISEELQAIGDALDGRVEYVFGAYYFDEDATSYDTSLSPGRPRADRYVTIGNSAYAAYGQVTARPAFIDGLYITAGARWSHDKRRATLQDVTVPAVGAPIFKPPGSGDNNFENFSPNLVIGYNVTDDVNLYAKLSRGYKSGGFNVRASSIARFNEGFRPETLTSYEIGARTSWLDNQLRFNATAFVADYKNIQINVQSDPTNFTRTDVLNAGKGRINGIELDIQARPTRGLTFSANYAYLDAEYQRIITATGANIADQFRFVQSPPHSLSTSIECLLPASPVGTFGLFVQYNLQDRKFASSNSAQFKVGSYGLLDARLTLSDIPVGFGDWEFALFGKNLTDKPYYIDHFSVGIPAAVFGEPRTYGIELRVKY